MTNELNETNETKAPETLTAEIEPKAPETASRTVQFQPNILDSSKIPGPGKITKQTALEKIKNSLSVLKETDSDASYVLGLFDIAKTKERKDFAIAQDADELAKSFYGVREVKEPGAVNTLHFAIDSADNAGPVNSIGIELGVTIEKVKDDASLADLAHKVNFDMLSELRESVYNAKFELDKVTAVKDTKLEDLAKSLQRVESILNEERRVLVVGNLDAVIENLQAIDDSKLAPEDRKGLWDAVHNLQCAKDLVNKANYKDPKGMNEQAVQEFLTKSIKLYPKIKEDQRMNTLIAHIFELA